MGDNNCDRSPSRKLTYKQEKFAQAIVDGYSQSEAYKVAYATTNMLPATIHNSAYKLMHHGEIAARISEARQVVASGLTATRIWTAGKLVDELPHGDETTDTEELTL